MRTATLRPTVISVFAAIFAWLCWAQAEPKVASNQDQAVQILEHYIHLRLQDADWKEYSKFITWPDEPSWDCKWVASTHKIGAPIRKGRDVLIPVVYSRLGLFCYDFDFKSEPKSVVVNYELVKPPTGWKVNAPIPDYPDISAHTLLTSLRTTAANTSETPERRAKAEATARKISETLKKGKVTPQRTRHPL